MQICSVQADTVLADSLLVALRSSLKLFGDKLYIKHSPIVHQEGLRIQTSFSIITDSMPATTQILLMISGYYFRADQSHLKELSRSSDYLNAVSNRLGASSPRAKFLGMVVGTAVSELVDQKDRQMKFGSDDLNSPDGLWYRSLPKINDTIGSLADLKVTTVMPTKPPTKTGKPKTKSKKSTVATRPASKVISIEEINDDPDSEDEDLPMYQKPDSDPSDEDEDPTLVQRDKPTAPV